MAINIHACRHTLGKYCVWFFLAINSHPLVANEAANINRPEASVGTVNEKISDTSNLHAIDNTGGVTNHNKTAVSDNIVKMAPLDTGAALAKTFGGLAVILALIVLCAKGTKLLTNPTRGTQPILHLVSVLPLGTKEKLALVEVGGKQILIGVTAHQISPLLELNEPVKSTPAAPQQSSLSAKTAAEFSKKLNEFLNAGNRHS